MTHIESEASKTNEDKYTGLMVDFFEQYFFRKPLNDVSLITR